MGKRRANFWMAAILHSIRTACGFERRDSRLSKKTRHMYSALVRGAHRGDRKVQGALRRFVRSIRSDARAAGLLEVC
jgi:hypothetical protein